MFHWYVTAVSDLMSTTSFLALCVHNAYSEGTTELTCVMQLHDYPLRDPAFLYGNIQINSGLDDC
jgi:hypothetical protein